MIGVAEALSELCPTSRWCVKDEVIEWLDEKNTRPTDEKINTKITELQAEYDAQEYARNRKKEYDALNQFEMQFDDKENGTTTWDDAVNAIKAKYPKPE